MKTVFTNDGSASFTIKRLFWQFVTTDALHVFKRQFLVIQVIYLSMGIASVNFLIHIKFKFVVLSVLRAHHWCMTMCQLLLVIIGLQLYSLCTLHLNRLSSWLNLSLFFFFLLGIIRIHVQSLILLNWIVLRLPLDLYSVESLRRWLHLMIDTRALLDLIEVRSVIMNFSNINSSVLEWHWIGLYI